MRIKHLNEFSRDSWHKGIFPLFSFLSAGFRQRPKSLKVFVNPTSHKKEAYKIYLDEVAPLFKLADIQADVTSTSYTHMHCTERLRFCRSSQVGGKMCAGDLGPPGLHWWSKCISVCPRGLFALRIHSSLHLPVNANKLYIVLNAIRHWR